MFNLGKSLYFKFSAIGGVIYSLFIFIIFYTAAIGKGQELSKIGDFIFLHTLPHFWGIFCFVFIVLIPVMLLIVYLAPIILGADFIFFKKIQSGKGIQNPVLFTLMTIFFSIFQLIIIFFFIHFIKTYHHISMYISLSIPVSAYIYYFIKTKIEQNKIKSAEKEQEQNEVFCKKEDEYNQKKDWSLWIENSLFFNIGLFLGYTYLVLAIIAVIIYFTLPLLYLMSYFVPGLGYLLVRVVHTPWLFITVQTIFLIDIVIFLYELIFSKKTFDKEKKLDNKIFTVNIFAFIIFVLISVGCMALLTKTDYKYFWFKKSPEVKVISQENIQRRTQPLLTLLKSGNVLISGGFSSDGYSKRLEICNPKNQECKFVGNTNIERSVFAESTILLDDGRVFMTHGNKYSEIFNPETEETALIKDDNICPNCDKLLKLSDGNILLYSGYPAAVFNPKTMKYKTADFSNIEYIYEAFNMDNGNLLLIADKKVIIYSPKDNRIIKSIEVSKKWHTAHSYILYNKKKNILYCFSANKFCTLEIETGKEKIISVSCPFRKDEINTKAIMLNESKVLFTNSNYVEWFPSVPSSIPAGFNNKLSNNILIFDLNTKQYSKLNLGKPYHDYSAIKLNDNKVFFTGGKIVPDESVPEKRKQFNKDILIYSY